MAFRFDKDDIVCMVSVVSPLSLTLCILCVVHGLCPREDLGLCIPKSIIIIHFMPWLLVGLWSPK